MYMQDAFNSSDIYDDIKNELLEYRDNPLGKMFYEVILKKDILKLFNDKLFLKYINSYPKDRLYTFIDRIPIYLTNIMFSIFHPKKVYYIGNTDDINNIWVEFNFYWDMPYMGVSPHTFYLNYKLIDRQVEYFISKNYVKIIPLYLIDKFFESQMISSIKIGSQTYNESLFINFNMKYHILECSMVLVNLLFSHIPFEKIFKNLIEEIYIKIYDKNFEKYILIFSDMGWGKHNNKFYYHPINSVKYYSLKLGNDTLKRKNISEEYINIYTKFQNQIKICKKKQANFSASDEIIHTYAKQALEKLYEVKKYNLSLYLTSVNELMLLYYEYIYLYGNYIADNEKSDFKKWIIKNIKEDISEDESEQKKKEIIKNGYREFIRPDINKFFTSDINKLNQSKIDILSLTTIEFNTKQSQQSEPYEVLDVVVQNLTPAVVTLFSYSLFSYIKSFFPKHSWTTPCAISISDVYNNTETIYKLLKTICGTAYTENIIETQLSESISVNYENIQKIMSTSHMKYNDVLFLVSQNDYSLYCPDKNTIDRLISSKSSFVFFNYHNPPYYITSIDAGQFNLKDLELTSKKLETKFLSLYSKYISDISLYANLVYSDENVTMEEFTKNFSIDKDYLGDPFDTIYEKRLKELKIPEKRMDIDRLYKYAYLLSALKLLKILLTTNLRIDPPTKPFKWLGRRVEREPIINNAEKIIEYAKEYFKSECIIESPTIFSTDSNMILDMFYEYINDCKENKRFRKYPRTWDGISFEENDIIGYTKKDGNISYAKTEGDEPFARSV